MLNTSYRPPCKILRGQKRTPSQKRRANHLSVMIAPGAVARKYCIIFDKFCKYLIINKIGRAMLVPTGCRTNETTS